MAERRERRLLWDREKVKGENFYNVVVVGVAVCCVAEEEPSSSGKASHGNFLPYKLSLIMKRNKARDKLASLSVTNTHI